MNMKDQIFSAILLQLHYDQLCDFELPSVSVFVTYNQQIESYANA